ncbi:glycosyltransferase family 39 protein [Actinomarinicola tropica]|uniref:Uncharacterized protein n=1 Tax=Actinomarinicola tropica TaxID=2789776 RepID=A0A5Q2RPN1_9ACTN|nr:glycosyltransferase family 39 protein [Actinomarinicola tropica]QGG96077.1 hypothetical protein GH723_13765 [Actinomarinicola tropica]
MGERWRLLLIGATVLVVATSSVLVRHELLPLLSWNSDEAVHLFQADLILDGRLTADAALHDESFRPWLSGTRDGRVFLAYQPGVPLLLALSQLLTGSTTPILVTVAGGLVWATYGAASALWGDRRVAAWSAALVGLSPIVLLHAGLHLGYLPAATALFAALWAALRAAERRSAAVFVGAGAALGAAVLMRPFDALLFALAIAPLVLVRARRADHGVGPTWWVRPIAFAAVGALPAVALTAWFNARTTGDPLEFPITALGGPNTFGFGTRALMEGSDAVDYDIGLAVESLAWHLASVPWWMAGGLGLVLLAAWGLTRPGPVAERRTAAALVLLYPLGYVVWWATATASEWLDSFGPYYYLPSLVALALLGARGVVALGEVLPSRRAAGLVVVVLTVATLPAMPGALRWHEQVTDRFERIEAAVPDHLDDAIVVLDVDHVLFAHPYFANDPGLEDDVVFAVSDADVEALGERFPERTIYRLDVPAVDGTGAGLECVDGPGC